MRLANHTALTSNIITTGIPPVVNAKGNEKSIPGGAVFLPGGGIRSIDSHGRNGELGVGFVATIDLHRDTPEKV